MNLNEMVKKQRDFDAKHGWAPDPSNTASVLDFLVRDLIGLFGEMGEFSNVVKKLQRSSPDEATDILDQYRPALREELIDFLIYVVRFASYLDINLEEEYARKLEANDVRFRKFLLHKEATDE